MDTRDKQQLLQELKESEDRYRSVTETSIDAIITASEKDAILTWNKGAEMIFGYRPEEILGRSVTTIIPKRYRTGHYEGVMRFLRTGEKHIMGKKLEMMALRKDGTEFPVELSLSYWQSESGVYFGAIIRDIADRRQLERIQEDVQRMMRHDLRSPLIGITGLARRLRKGTNLTDEQRKAVILIQESGEKTLKLLDRSRDLFQMEQGTYALSPQPVNLMEILDCAKNQLESLSLKKSITVRISISKPSGHETPEIVHGDAELLEMMLANLLKNAIEASPEDAPIDVDITTDQQDGKSMHVIDLHNGAEIPEEIRDHFFEAYTTSGKVGGTGLGTYNASLIARTHHGNIRFTTSPAQGTHVIVSLPSRLEDSNQNITGPDLTA